jgi:ABC-2 type transport system ATP-binding protein
MLKVEHLSKSIGAEKIIIDIDLTINKGEILVLFGKNGSGKTTLIKCIAGLWNYNKGNITYKGIKKKEFGLVIGNAMLINSLTVVEYLDFVCELKKISTEISKKKISNILNKLNLVEYKNKLISQLSKGNKSKLSLAACLVYDPKLILLDEPFTGMDLIGVNESIKLIKESSKNGAIIILSTHNVEIIREFNSPIAVIRNKKLKTLSKNKVKNLKNSQFETFLL